MDNFELNTFSQESKFDWDIFGGETLSSSQASQQSDYLRNLDLGLDLNDLDFLQSTPEQGCRDEMKQEPASPMYDVINELLYLGADATPQQLSPDVTVAQQMHFLPPNDECEDVYGNGEVTTIYPEAIQEIPVEVAPVDLTADEEEIFDCNTPSACSTITTDADSLTPDSGVSFTFIRTPIQPSQGDRTNRRLRNSQQDRIGSPVFSDDYLRRVGTKEFNRRINDLHLSSEEVKKWKRRRRTLKNRGYAQNCRQRRIGKHQEADEENMRLRRELMEERVQSARLRQRIAELEAALAAVRAQSRI